MDILTFIWIIGACVTFGMLCALKKPTKGSLWVAIPATIIRAFIVYITWPILFGFMIARALE